MLLVAPDSADELERGLLRLASDPPLRSRLAAAARARVERDFSFARRMERFVAIYDRALEPSA
jgi:glycosyltransferase involved in cell wall biosynthesis